VASAAVLVKSACAAAVLLCLLDLRHVPNGKCTGGAVRCIEKAWDVCARFTAVGVVKRMC